MYLVPVLRPRTALYCELISEQQQYNNQYNTTTLCSAVYRLLCHIVHNTWYHRTIYTNTYQVWNCSAFRIRSYAIIIKLLTRLPVSVRVWYLVFGIFVVVQIIRGVTGHPWQGNTHTRYLKNIRANVRTPVPFWGQSTQIPSIFSPIVPKTRLRS